MFPGGQVHVRLPRGREFNAFGGTIHDIFLGRRGVVLTEMWMNGYPVGADIARDMAVAWARLWDVPTGPLERSRLPARASAPQRGGYVVTVRVTDTGIPKQPASASIGFRWPGAR